MRDSKSQAWIYDRCLLSISCVGTKLPLISRHEELKYLCGAEPWSARQIRGKEKGTEKAASQPPGGSKLDEGTGPTLSQPSGRVSAAHICTMEPHWGHPQRAPKERPTVQAKHTLLQSVRTQSLKFPTFFLPGLFIEPLQRGLLGFGGSLLYVSMEEGGNRTLQVFILKVYHAFGWLLVPKLIMLVEEVWKQNRQNTESK